MHSSEFLDFFFFWQVALPWGRMPWPHRYGGMAMAPFVARGNPLVRSPFAAGSISTLSTQFVFHYTLHPISCILGPGAWHDFKIRYSRLVAVALQHGGELCCAEASH